MKVTLLFLCCLLVKGLVAKNENQGNQKDCARYVEVQTTGSGYENLGITAGGSPAIFTLDADVVLGESKISMPIVSLYRHASGGCIWMQDTPGGTYVVFQNDCTGSPDDFNPDVSVNLISKSGQTLQSPCFLYSTNYTKEEDNALADGLIDDIYFKTPAAPCSACRVINDGGAGQLYGNYVLQDLYNPNCGSDTDMCGYEKDGETYCFQENGMYDIDFSCPAS